MGESLQIDAWNFSFISLVLLNTLIHCYAILQQIFGREDFLDDDKEKTMIKVTNTRLNVCTLWSVPKFEDKLMQMRDLYQVRFIKNIWDCICFMVFFVGATLCIFVQKKHGVRVESFLDKFSQICSENSAMVFRISYCSSVTLKKNFISGELSIWSLFFHCHE